MTGFYMHSV